MRYRRLVKIGLTIREIGPEPGGLERDPFRIPITRRARLVAKLLD